MQKVEAYSTVNKNIYNKIFHPTMALKIADHESILL